MKFLGSPRPSYWPYAFETCGIPAEEVDQSFKFKRIDFYWRSVGTITGDDGKPKYAQLFAMVKCILSLSHGNAVPERGFSINKKLIDCYSSTVYEDTIEAHPFGMYCFTEIDFYFNTVWIILGHRLFHSETALEV